MLETSLKKGNLDSVRRTLAALALTLFSLVLGTDASAQVNLIADDFQSIRPNLFLSEDLNQRGLTATAEVCIRDCDQIWLISTRQVCGYDLDSNQLKAIRLIEHQWQATSISEFQREHSSDLTTESVFYIHGNMTDLNWSIVRGLQVYKNLIAENPDAPPVRYVIWSWPSERQTIPIKDALVKARKAKCVGYTLRGFLDSLQGPRPILIGYSFGSQVVASALQSPFGTEGLGKYYVTLIAPAFERDFANCEIDGWKLEQNVQQMDAYVNATDRVIKANSHLCRKKYRRSIKCDHLVSSKIGNCFGFLEEIDITNCQSKHSIILYSQQPAIVDGFRNQMNEALAKSLPPIGLETVAPQAEPTLLMESN